MKNPIYFLKFAISRSIDAGKPDDGDLIIKLKYLSWKNNWQR